MKDTNTEASKKIRALRSFATLEKGQTYDVGEPLPDGTMRLQNNVYIHGPSACVSYKRGISWEYVEA